VLALIAAAVYQNDGSCVDVPAPVRFTEDAAAAQSCIGGGRPGLPEMPLSRLRDYAAVACCRRGCGRC
jgi:hypothetical protein